MLNRILGALMALVIAAPALASDLGNSNWSETAASNNAASPNGWTSGTMLPSQVEPTAREMMSALKKWWNRSNAVKTSGGSANTQTLTYDVAEASYYTGQCFSFIPGFTNTGATTLNVSGLGAKSIFYTGAALTGSEIIVGLPVTVCYDGTQFNLIGNSSSTAATLIYAGKATASGSSVLDFTGISAPYTDYFLQCRDIILATDAINMALQIGTGTGPVTYQTGASYAYGNYGRNTSAAVNGGTTGATSIILNSNTIGNAGNSGFAMELWLHNPLGTALRKNIEWKSSYTLSGSGVPESVSGFGQYTAAATAITGIRLLASTGNITSGSCTFYGLR